MSSTRRVPSIPSAVPSRWWEARASASNIPSIAICKRSRRCSPTASPTSFSNSTIATERGSRPRPAGPASQCRSREAAGYSIPARRLLHHLGLAVPTLPFDGIDRVGELIGLDLPGFYVHDRVSLLALEVYARDSGDFFQGRLDRLRVELAELPTQHERHLLVRRPGCHSDQDNPDREDQ